MCACVCLFVSVCHPTPLSSSFVLTDKSQATHGQQDDECGEPDNSHTCASQQEVVAKVLPKSSVARCRPNARIWQLMCVCVCVCVCVSVCLCVCLCVFVYIHPHFPRPR